MGAKTIEVTENNFQSAVLNSAEPVLVDFWAEWCGPCKAIAPFVDQIADEYAGKLTVAKLDADAYPEIVMNYQIQGIPTLLLFKGGKLVERIIGFQGKEKIVNKIKPHLN